MVKFEIHVDKSNLPDWTSYAIVGLHPSGEIEVFGIYYNAEGRELASQRLRELQKEEKIKNRKVMIRYD